MNCQKCGAEIEDNKDVCRRCKQKSEDKILVITSVVLCLVGFLFFQLGPLFVGVAIILSVFAVFHSIRWKYTLKEWKWAIVGILVSVTSFVILSHIIEKDEKHKIGLAYRMLCATNLSNLGKAMLVYESNFGRYPQADKWCDLILETENVTEKQFICKANKNQRCSYAINPHCQPESPNDVVLLFETKGGWNCFGGRELLSTSNHKTGSNVLFNDGMVKFIEVQEFNDLKWE